MGRYKEMWTGQWGWYNALMFSMMGLMMVFLVLPEHLKIWMAPGTLIYLLSFWGIQNKVILAKKEKIEGNRFIDARIVRDKGYSEDLLLGFANFEELELTDLDKNIEDLDFYKRLKKEVKHTMVMEQMSIELEMQSSNGIFNSSSFTPVPTLPSTSETTTEKPKKKKGAEFDLTKIYSDEIQAIEDAEIRINKDQQDLFKKFLKENTIYAYSGNLYEGVSFSDSDKHKFDSCILVCRNELEKEFLFSKLALLVEGYEVSAQAAKAELITVAWMGSYCPIFIVDYTERHAVNKLDTIITGDLTQTIKEKTMEKWIFSKRHYFKRYEADLRLKDIDADENFRRYTDLAQDLEERRIDNLFDDPSQDSRLMNISKRLYIGLIVFSCLSVILMGALIGVVV